MIKRLYIKIENLEPFLHIHSEKGNGKSHYKWGLYYPFRKLKLKLYNRKLKDSFEKIGYKIIKCQGCGEGYAEWIIRNPNYNTNDCWLVCQHCVGFYDRTYTRRRLESKWELQAQRLDK